MHFYYQKNPNTINQLNYFYSSTFFFFLVPLINKLYYRLLGSKPVERVDISYKIFNFDCLFKQYVTEWAIPT